MTGKMPFVAMILTFFAATACDDPAKTVSSCGDGYVDPGEDCDGDVGESSCTSLGYYNVLGTLTCRADCSFDVTGCGGICGDDVVQDDNGELCDGANLNGAACTDSGWHGGTLTCLADCSGYDESGCEAAGRCGDGTRQAEFEDCEGTDLGGATCPDLGFYRGTLACGADCAFDTTACTERCGDGIVQAGDGEQCDGSNLETASCESLGWYEGSLSCGADCRFDTINCIGECGDDIIQDAFAEECDGDNLGAQTCESVGHYRGTLACDQCAFDASACERCGDGVVSPDDGEACDTADLAGAICRDLGHLAGVPSCESTCQLGAGACVDALQWGTNQIGDFAGSVAVDADGNIYVTGQIWASLDGQTYLGSGDAYLIKFGRDGSRLWTRLWGTPQMDNAYGVAVDAAGNVFVAGATRGALEGASAGGDDGFLIRFDRDGNQLWTRQWGTAGADIAVGVGVDALGNACVTGAVEGSIFGETAQGGSDAMLSCYDADGDRLWTRIWGSPEYQAALAIAIHTDGTVAVAGTTFGVIDGQPIVGESSTFVSVFNPAGVYQWTRTRFMLTPPYRLSMTMDADKNIFMLMKVSSVVDGQPRPGGDDCALWKYDATGSWAWTRTWGTPQTDTPIAAVVTPSGDVLVAGYTNGDLDGHPRVGAYDVFLTSHDTDGNRLWTRLAGTTGDDRPWALALDPVGPIGDAFICGSTNGTFPGQTLLGTEDLFLLLMPTSTP